MALQTAQIRGHVCRIHKFIPLPYTLYFKPSTNPDLIMFLLTLSWCLYIFAIWISYYCLNIINPFLIICQLESFLFSSDWRATLKIDLKIHCKCLQGFTGCPQVFPSISMEKGCKNHRETLYSSKGKIVYVVGKPCNIYRLQGKPNDNYRISPQSVNITGFPHNTHNLSL